MDRSRLSHRFLSRLRAFLANPGVSRVGIRLLAIAVIAYSLKRVFPQLTVLPNLLAAATLVGATLLTRTWPMRCLSAVMTWTALASLGSWVRYQLTFGAIGYDDFVAILQTDASEAKAYVLGLTTAELLQHSLLVAAVLLGLSVWRRSAVVHPVKPSWPRRSVPLLLWLCAVAVLLEAQPVSLGEQWRHFADSVRDVRAQREQQRLMLNEQLSGKSSVPPAKLRGTIILALGESMTRRHMSLYGYARPTTPRLDGLADQLFVHTDTVSLHSHTTLTVPPMFGAPLGHKSPSPVTTPLIASLRRSGVKTFWYSNQNEIGAFENPVTLIARTSDVWKFQKNQFFRDADKPLYDDWLLPQLQEALHDSAPDKFVTLHFYAPHWPYCEGFPASGSDLAEADGLGEAYFGKAADWSSYVNCYDNAIRHVDGLLSQVISMAREASEPTAVVFVSDHGENPATMTAHDENTHSGYQVEVPLFFYVNAAGRQAWKFQLDALRSHLGERYSNAYLGNSLLDLAGVDGKLFEPTRSLFSRSFVPIDRVLFAANPELAVHYDSLQEDRKDALEIARNTLRNLHEKRPGEWAKTWAHGVDSVGKLLEAKDLFAGVALHVCFDAARHHFQICNVAAEPTSLSLETYLQAAADRPHLKYWMTWQAIRRTEVSLAVAELARLERDFKLTGRLVLETGSDALYPELKRLTRQRIVHAYRLPAGSAVCQGGAGKVACAQMGASLVRNMGIVGATVLSFAKSNEPFVRQHARELRGFRQVVEDLDITADRRDFDEALPVLDPYMAALVGFRSTFDR